MATDSPFAVGLAGLLPAIPVGDYEQQDGADEDERGYGAEHEVEGLVHLTSRRVDWKERALVCWLGQLE